MVWEDLILHVDLAVMQRVLHKAEQQRTYLAVRILEMP